jgi:hypothetical protein
MCGDTRVRGGSDGRKTPVPELRGAGTGAILDQFGKAPAGRDRRGFPILGTIDPTGEKPPGERRN